MEVKIVKDNRAKALSELESKTSSYLDSVGKLAQMHAKANAPVDTGRLRASIEYETNANSVSLTSDVEYAIYQEEGTIYIRAKHFMRNALAHHANEYIQLLERTFRG